MKRCAYILVRRNAGISPDDYKLVHDPTIGEIHSYRQKESTVILRRVIQRYGNEVHTYWMTDDGNVLISRIDCL